MKTTSPKTARAPGEKANLPALKVPFILILLAYALIPVIIPDFYALDPNGPKFLFISALNLISFVFLLTGRDFAGREVQAAFFRNRIGMVYAAFMCIVLLSFAKAVNLPESVLSFSKYFTVFCSAYILTAIFLSDRRYFRMLIISMAFLLLMDSFTVFVNILMYIAGMVPGVYEIKSVYANKNILASAIFVKIPFALWLFSFEKGWLKKLGFVVLFCAFLASFFMSTRTFYLGLIFLAVIYLAFILVRNIRSRDSKPYLKPVFFTGALVLAFCVFTLTQSWLYPKTADVYNASVTERFSTISSEESSASQRLESWKRSALLFKSEPLAGVGTGNWKIRVLQYENPKKSGYILMLKNHNDFIEITTETGIFGGLLFCSIFVLLAFNFLRAFFRSGADESSLVYLFIPAFGIFCYSFDAFFNFPADRPEIQSVFAMFIGAGIAFSAVPARDGKAGASWLRISLSAVMILLLAVSSFVLLLNYKSLVIQRYVQEDQITDTLRSSTGLLVAGYPFIPTVTTLAEPIAVQKARYLINDGKYQEAIDILRPDRSSPYDGRREMFITMAYSKMGNVDSALVYAWRVRDLKPLNFSSLDYICKVFESLGNKEEALKLLREFILVEKDTPEAWQHIATLFWETGQYQMAVDAIDSASVHLPKDTLIRKLKVKLANDIIVQPFMAQYSAAMECLSKRNYPEAQKYLDEIISKETRIAMVYAGRAYCYYTSRLYDKCLGDIKRTMELGNSTPDLFNLRGLSYIGLGNNDAACKDFKTAAERGDRDGAANFRRFCK